MNPTIAVVLVLCSWLVFAFLCLGLVLVVLSVEKDVTKFFMILIAAIVTCPPLMRRAYTSSLPHGESLSPSKRIKKAPESPAKENKASLIRRFRRKDSSKFKPAKKVPEGNYTGPKGKGVKVDEPPLNSESKSKPSKPKVKAEQKLKKRKLGHHPTVTFEYEDSHGDWSERDVTVYEFLGGTKFRGFCHKRQQIRTFRFDRVLGGVTDTDTGEYYSSDEFKNAI